MKNIISVFLFISFSVFGAGTNADSVLSLLKRGKLSEVAGDYNEAVDLYKQAIAQDSSHYEAHLYLGNLYHTTNELAKSLRQYNQAIKYGKDRAEAYFYRGNLQIDLGSVFGAVNDYTYAIERDPNDMQYYMCRGFAHANMGDIYNAVNDYSIAIQLNPEDSKTFYNMAIAQGMVQNSDLDCGEVTELKEEGNVRAELVYMNFCLK